MTRPFRIRRALALLAFLAMCIGRALAADGAAAEIDGKALLRKNCGRCHSIEAAGESPLKQAPPLRDVYLKYPVEKLEFELAEGMGSRHRDMPQIQFSAEQVAGILTYLSGLAGQEAPAGGPATTSPGTDETEPP